MTAADRSTLDDLLTAHRGDFALAAKARGEPEKDFRLLIEGDHFLRVRWIDAMKVVDPIDRPGLGLGDDGAARIASDTLKPADQRLLDGVEGQDRKLAALDWQSLGIKDPKEVDLLRSFEGFLGGRIVRTLDATHGGMLSGFAKTAVRFHRTSDLLDAVNPSSEEGQILHAQWAKQAELLIKFNADASRAAHLRAMMMKIAQDDSKKKSNGRPGFTKAKNVTPKPKSDKAA